MNTDPSARQSVQIGTADAAVSDFDVDICFLPGFGFKGLPLHVADGVLVEAHPALELVVLGLLCHGCRLENGLIGQGQSCDCSGKTWNLLSIRLLESLVTDYLKITLLSNC